MSKLGMEEGVPIEHNLVTKSIEHAQKQVESRNFEIRKHLLEYDDVMNKQREAIYSLRRKVLEEESHAEYVLELCTDILKWQAQERCSQTDPRDWDLHGLQNDLRSQFDLDVEEEKLAEFENTDDLSDYLYEKAEQTYTEKKNEIGVDRWNFHERMLMLHVIDSQWKDHLYALDHLKEGIGFRGYGQRDPLVEYKKESFQLFEEMMNRMEDEIVKYVFFTQPPQEERVAPVRAPRAVQFSGPSLQASAVGVAAATRKAEKVGRNDPCPCGSGKKYKKCCGVNA
jgi:preprotein translocase subunit SecA